MSNEVDFLHTDKHESLLKIDTMILMGMNKDPQSSQNSKIDRNVFTISQKIS